MPRIQSHSTGASAEFERETGLVLWNPKPLRPKPRRKQSAGLVSGLKKRCVFRWWPYWNERRCSMRRCRSRLQLQPKPRTPLANFVACASRSGIRYRDNHGLLASIIRPPSAVVLQCDRTTPSERPQHQQSSPFDTQQPIPVGLAVHGLQTTRIKSRITYTQ